MSTTYTYQIYAKDSKGNTQWVYYDTNDDGYYDLYPNEGDATNFTLIPSDQGYYLSVADGIGPSSNYDYGSLLKQNFIVKNDEYNGHPQTLWGFYIKNSNGQLVQDFPTLPVWGYECYIKDLSYTGHNDQRWWKNSSSPLTNDQLSGDPISDTFANSSNYVFYITVGSQTTTALIKSPYILATSDKSNQDKNLVLNWDSYPDTSLTTITQCSPEYIQYYQGKIINDSKLFLANQEFSILIDDEVESNNHNFQIIKTFGTIAYIAKFDGLYIFASSKDRISSRSWDKLQQYLKNNNFPPFYPLNNVVKC